MIDWSSIAHEISCQTPGCSSISNHLAEEILYFDDSGQVLSERLAACVEVCQTEGHPHVSQNSITVHKLPINKL